MDVGCLAQRGVWLPLLTFSAPLSMGTAPGAGQLGRAQAWERAEKASLQTGGRISHCHLSPGLLPAPALFSFPMG